MDCELSKSMETFSSADMASETANFECYICFEWAKEPILTRCGHLYCWPCLYQWLRLHSHYHECPVCKSVIQYEKLIPIYGRGKTNSDPRSKFPDIFIPFQQMSQRPHTVRVETGYIPSNEPDPLSFMPMAVARIGHMTLSTIFGALPVIFNSFQMHGFHDATVYGTTSGVQNMFSSSGHGAYVCAFHNYHLGLLKWKPVAWKVVFAILGCLVLLFLIFTRGWFTCFLEGWGSSY